MHLNLYICICVFDIHIKITQASSMGSFPLALVIVQREGFGALFRLVTMIVVMMMMMMMLMTMVMVMMMMMVFRLVPTSSLKVAFVK